MPCGIELERRKGEEENIDAGHECASIFLLSPFSFSSFPLCFGLNLSEHGSEAKLDYSEEGFAKNAAAHLARTQFTVDEDYGNFLNLKA